MVDRSYDCECMVPHGTALLECYGRCAGVEPRLDGCLWIGCGINESVRAMGRYFAPVSKILGVGFAI